MFFVTFRKESEVSESVVSSQNNVVRGVSSEVNQSRIQMLQQLLTAYCLLPSVS